MLGLSTPLLGLLAIAAGALFHGAALWWQVRGGQAAADRAASALADAAPGDGDAWVWREIPPDCQEPKLVVGYERDSRHRVLQYPTLPPASHVRFASGAVHLMTTSALERTLDADDGLRDRLGLPPVEPPDGS